MTATEETLGFAANEDPFVLAKGGFYRRWMSMVSDLDELRAIISRLEATTEDKWVPVWKEAGQAHEDAGDALEAAGNHEEARTEYLLAKTYYAIGRFPGEISPGQGRDKCRLRARLSQGLGPSGSADGSHGHHL